MFQGMGKETIELNSNWGFEPSEVNYVILSHAHIDHVGLLPKLVKDGYKGKVYCTPQTIDLAKLLMLDSAHIQESDVLHANKIKKKKGHPQIEPLYTEEDVEAVYPLLVPVPYNEQYHISDDIELVFTDCGHILGSAAVNLKIVENGKVTRITFSGDVGRYNDLILRSPQVFPQADFILIESTYGNKLHEMIVPSADALLKYIVHTCLEKKGKLIIPSFSVGRTQEILYLLNRLENERRLPPINYYVDSPLSIKATEVIKNHPECFNKEVQDLLKIDKEIFNFKGLYFTETVEDSKKLSALKDPCVIISASGMAEAGRVKHHIAHSIDKVRNTILIVGYCEPNSLGGKLRKGDKEVTIFGEHHQVIAEVGVIETMSAHGDYEDLCQWLSCQNPGEVKKLFLVHGEYDVQQSFRERLIKKGFGLVEIPYLHEQVGLG